MDTESSRSAEPFAENNTATRPRPEVESNRPRKKVNRGKYVLRACMHCQHRKIKCEGGTPCSQCISRNRDCISGNRAPPPVPRGRELAAGESIASVSHNPSQLSLSLKRVSSSEILRRLVSLENQISTVLGRSTTQDDHENAPHSYGSVTSLPKSPMSEVSDPSDSHHQVFFAEPCIDQAIKEAGAEGGNLESTADQEHDLDGKGGSLTPNQSSRLLEASLERQSEGWLKTLLASHNITPDKNHWHDLLNVYFSEVHPLYPFLHPPTIWATFEWMWQNELLLPANELSDERRVSLAIILLCLASGRCTSPSRTHTSLGGGRHSAGWGFYSVATRLLFDLLDLSRSSRPATLIEIQALLQMAMYLFRLDAMEKAELILAQAISRSHVLNLHRKHLDENLPLFESEMRRRSWWCLFVMDRRLTLETARPNLIQWDNVDLKNARSLSDEFLEAHRQSLATASSLEEEIKLEIEKQPVTSIGYLHAISSFARISGEILKVLQAPPIVSESTLEVLDAHLELIVEKTRKELPSYLVHNPDQSFTEQYGGRDWWQIKLSVLLYIRYLFLKILLRNKSFETSATDDSMATPSLASSVLCGRLACTVVMAYDQIPSSYPKFVFPFTHFITSASMILLGLATKHPTLKERYRSSITSAVNTLYTYCHTTWVSGKSARTVAQLNRIAKRLYSRCNDNGSSTGQTQLAPARDVLSNSDSALKSLSSTGNSYSSAITERATDVGAGGSVHNHRQNLGHEDHLHQSPVAEIFVTEGSDHTTTLEQGMLNTFGARHEKIRMISSDPTQTGMRPTQEPLIPELDAGNDVITRPPAGSTQNQQQLLPPYDLTNSWLTSLPDGSFPQIPDWMMSNFDFEDCLSTSGASNTGLVQASGPGPGVITFPNSVLQIWDLLDVPA